MADQTNHGPQGWDYNFPGEFYLDSMADPFDFLDIDLFTGELWADDPTSLLHGPISSGMDLFLGDNMWMESQPLAPHGLSFHEINTSESLDVALSYHMGYKSESHTNSSSSGLATPLSAYASSITPNQTLSVPYQPVPTLPNELKRRRVEDFQTQFMGPQPVATDKRRRQPYKDKRRKEVGMVRQVGACIRCRIMKTTCSSESTCERCIKHWNDPYLSQALCGRPKLLHDRLNSTKPDLWDRKHDMRWLKRNLTPFQGPRRIIKLSLVNFCDITSKDIGKDSWSGGHNGLWIPVAPLQIVVQDFEPEPGRDIKHYLNVTFTDSNKTLSTAPSYYAIPTDSLPTLERLSKWALDSTRLQHRSLFDEGLQGSFMSLARRYHVCKAKLPLRSLLRHAVKLSCLHGVWCSALPEPKMTRDEIPRYASKAVHKQIAVIVTQEIDSLERDILGQLQAIIFNQRGLGQENELPVWICLWLLLLTYRRTIFHWSSRRNRHSHLEFSQYMYNMLISTYSSLFRSSTPLWHNFLKDDVFEKFGRDYSITERMGVIKTEMEFTQNENGVRDFQTSHDRLLRSLIFEHEKKLGEDARKRELVLRNSQHVT